jgi:hypothetical protein
MNASPPPAPTPEKDLYSAVSGVPAGMITDLSINRKPQLAGALPDDKPETTQSREFVVRAKKRYKKRYSVRIQIDGKVFNTNTRDISVGGLNVEDQMPDWVCGYFKVRIIKPNVKQQIELQCCLIENEDLNEFRHRLMILPLQNPTDEQNLEKWIAA